MVKKSKVYLDSLRCDVVRLNVCQTAENPLDSRASRSFRYATDVVRIDVTSVTVVDEEDVQLAVRKYFCDERATPLPYKIEEMLVKRTKSEGSSCSGMKIPSSSAMHS